MKSISYIGSSRRCPDDDLAFAVGVRITVSITIDVVLALRVGRMQQIHRIAHLSEGLCTFLGLVLARRNVCDSDKRPFIAEALDRLKKSRK
jgi:hypothetical protein